MKVITFAIFALAMAQTTAAVRTWDGGDLLNTNWTDSTNWSGNLPPVAGDSLVFPPIVSTTDKATNNNFAALTDFAGLTFSASDYSVAGNEFDLVSGGIVLNYTSGTTTITPVIRLTGAGQSFDTGIDKPQLTTGALNLNGNSLALNGFGTVDIGGNIVNSVGTPTITKLGAGKAVLRGFNNFSGNINVSAGTLYADGFFAGTGTITVGTSGILAGTNGGIVKPTTVTGTVAPGILTDGTTTLEFDSLAFASGAGTKTLDLDIQGTVAGDTHDRITISSGGSITLNSATLALDFGSYIPPIGTVFTLINNASASAISGTFAGIAQAASVVNGGQQLRFNYLGGTGNDFTATVLDRAPVASDQSVSASEDVALPVTLIASDANGQAINYNILTSPSNGTLSGSGASRTYTPNANFNGTDFFTFQTNAGSVNSNVATVTITVNPVNDAPTLNAISSPAAINEDAGDLVNLSGIGSGAINESQTLTITATSDNPALIPNPAVNYTSPNTTGSLGYNAVANANGTAVITVTVNDGQASNNTVTRTFTVTVNAVNDAPTLAAISNPAAINEDAGQQTVNLTGIGTGAANESQTLTITATSNNPAIIPNPTVIYTSPDTTGSLSYTPVANANGSAVITVTVNDGQANNSDRVTFTVTVNPVNDVPFFAKGFDVSRNEDSGFQTISFWASAVNDGDSGVNQALFFFVTNDNNALFATQPAVASNGTLAFTPAANAHGTATVSLSLTDDATAGGPALTSATQTFTITILPVNDPPVAIAQTVNTDEEAPLLITFSGTDVEGSLLTYSIVSNPIKGVLSGSGSSRTYTPGVNQTGLDSFTFIANDGTVNSDAVTVNITINPINDLPTISAVADQSTPEDGAGIFLNITVSDPDTSISDVVVSSTSTNPGLASVIPNGNTSARNVSVVPAPNQFGSATITLTVSDGQASNTEDFLLTVAPRNDAPVFIKGADVVIAEDAGPQTITGWATGISPGPANESAQTVGFEIASNSNSGLFSTAPSVGSDGTLTFTAAAQANGSAQVGIRLRDNGGTAFVDEQDASAVQQLLITVTAVNDPPVAIAASFVLVKNNSLSMSLAATDVEGGPLTFTIVTPPAHGSFGATTPPNLTYTPDTGYTGTDAFTFKVNDGAADSTAVTVSLEVLDSITHVWDGGGGNDNWSTPQNWMGDTLPPAGAILEFPASALRRTMVNDLVRVFTGLRFTANSYSISGDAVHISSFIESTAAVLNSPVSLLCPLHLEGDVIATRTAASSLRLSNVNTNGFDLEIRNTTNTAFMEIGGSISGSGGLIFDGSSGSLTFFSVSAVGGNSFTGGMHMKSGTVDLLGSSAHPFTVPGSLTIGGEPDKFAFLRNTGFGVSNADVTILEGGRIIVSGLCPVRNLTLAGNGTPINATGASPQLSIAGNLEVIAPVLASLSAPVRFLASSPGPHILSTVAGARLKIEAALTCGSSDSLSLTGEGDVFLNAVTTTLPAVTLAGGRFVVGVNVPATNVTLTGGALVGDGTVGSVNGSSGVGGGVYPADAFIELVFPVGTLSCGPLSLNASQTATFDFRNAPLGVGLSGFGTSLLNVSGTVSLGGSALSLNILPDDSPRPGEFITLIANDGTDPVVGTFGGLPEGSILTSGRYSFTLTYVGGTGNDVAVRVGYAPTGVTRIWDGEGANNLWSNPLNWDGNSVPAPGDSVDFPADALRLAGHNDLNMGFVFHRVRFFGGNANHGGNSYVSTGGVEFLNPEPGLISYFTPSIFLGAPMTIRTQGTVSAANLVATRGLPLEFNLGVGGSINLTRGDATAQISPIVKKGAGSLQISDPFSPIHTGQVIIEEGSVVPTNTPATSWLVGGTGSAATLQINQTGSLGAVRVQAGGLLLLANIQCSVAGLTLDSGSVNSLFGGAGPLLRVNGPLAVLTGACAIAPPFQAASATGEERLLTVAAGASLLAAQAVSTDNMGSYFRKAGAGPFTLGFSSPSLTRFEIGEGTAFFNAPASSALIRLQGGTLGGTGAVGNVTTVAGGSLAPGASPGILATKNLFWNSTTAFSIEIGGATPGSGYDQLAVTGSVSLGGATLDMQLINGFSPSSGGIFTLIDNDGVDAVSGTFAGLPEGSSFSAAGMEWLITYQGGTGNDVVVTRQAVQSALEAWRQLNFGSPANSGDAANNFDFDKDGLVNLLEFAFGLDPKSNSAHLLPQAQRVGNELVITFTPPPGVSGITFGAEASGSLAASDWLPVPNTGTAPQRVFRVPIGPENTKFMRLTVSDP